ncbi:hypothetical protein LB503_000688 [Fusarium chuoi]|nr:hypothetical protein LB503_000688 [Fusarium chuoi]
MSSNRVADLASTSKATPPVSTSNQLQAPESSNNSNASKARKRKGHRGGRKKRTRRKSFAALDDDDDHDEDREATGEGSSGPSTIASPSSINDASCQRHTSLTLLGFSQQPSTIDTSCLCRGRASGPHTLGRKCTIARRISDVRLRRK